MLHGGKALVGGTTFAGGINADRANEVTQAAKDRANANSSSKSSAAAAKSSASAAKSASDAAKSASDAASSIADTFENLQDWIEIEINRIKAERDRLSGLAGDTVDSQYNTQNAQLEQAIAQNNSLISVLESAYDAYIAQANRIGLDEGYAQKVRLGTLQIEDISDEDLKTRISEYQQWYEKALTAQTDLDEARAQNFDMQISQLENIVDDFEKAAGYIQAVSDHVASLSTRMETWGMLNTETNFDFDLNAKLQKQQKALRDNYESYYASLEQQFQSLVQRGTIAPNTDAWWDWQTKLQEIKTSIVECDTELINLEESVREFRFRQITDQIDDLDYLNDELSTYSDLLNETGFFDEKGHATTSFFTETAIGLDNLANARRTIALYDTAMKALKDDLDNGSISQQTYNEKLKEYRQAQLDAASAAKDARDSIISLVTEGIEKETEAMNKLIDARQKDLSARKANDDYARSVSDKQKEINRVNAQIQAMSGDERNAAQIRQLESQRQSLQQELDDIKEDRQYDLLSEGLDDFMSKFESDNDDRIRIIESSYEEQNKVIENALNQTLARQDAVSKELLDVAEQYGLKISQAILDTVGNREATGTISGGTWMKSDQGWRYYNNDGSQIVGRDAVLQWKGQTHTYGFDENGILVQNNWHNGKFYNWEGERVDSGWVDHNGQKYLLDSSGNKYTNKLVTDNGKKYYFTGSGAMLKNGWQEINGERCYFGDDGTMKQSEWLWDTKDYHWYYLQANGTMARNKSIKYNGYYCIVDENGIWHQEWDTKNPDFKKFPLTYYTGTRSAAQGPHLINDKGAEYWWQSKYGTLVQTNQSDIVLSHPQAKFLYDLSEKRNEVMDALTNASIGTPVNPSYNNGVNIHIDNVEGNFDETIVPQIEKIAQISFNNGMNRWERDRRNDRRKMGY